MTTLRRTLILTAAVVLVVAGVAIWWSAFRTPANRLEITTATYPLSESLETLAFETDAEINFEIDPEQPASIQATGPRGVLDILDLETSDQTTTLTADQPWLRTIDWTRTDLILTVSLPSLIPELKFKGDYLVSGQGVSGESARITSTGNLDGQLLTNKSNSLTVTLTGTGNLELKGDARVSDYTLLGDASLDARYLTSGRTTATLEGPAILRTQTQKSLTTQTSEDATVLYTLEPDELITRGSGTVASME